LVVGVGERGVACCAWGGANKKKAHDKDADEALLLLLLLLLLVDAWSIDRGFCCAHSTLTGCGGR
jgi:hypothetical protein